MNAYCDCGEILEQKIGRWDIITWVCPKCNSTYLDFEVVKRMRE